MKNLLLIISIVLISSISFAEHHEKKEMPQEMVNMQRYNSLNANHKLLTNLEGEWTAESSWKMTPDSPEQKSTAKVTIKSILGGRFIQTSYNDSSKDFPFEGIGYDGFDNVKKVFVSNWIDTMGTGIASSEGKLKPQLNIIEYNGKVSCTMTGAVRDNKSIFKFIDKNTTAYDMYDIDKDGKEFKSLSITYKRVKK